MKKTKHLGYLIEIDLSDWGYEGYLAWCSYKYIKAKDKYSLSMWIKRDDIDDTFKIDSQKIDTQFIFGTRETIEDNIYRIVECMASNKHFDYYIERFEYTYKCCDLGDDILELKESSNSKTGEL